MLIKLVEIYCKPIEHTSLNEDWHDRNIFLREIYINPDHIVYMREEVSYKKKLENSKLKEEIDPRQEFTKLHVNQGHTGIDIVVVGSLTDLEEKLRISKKHILKG